MTPEQLVVEYGLPAILLGATVEGEAVAIAGGIAAHRGLLPFWGVAAAAAGGSMLIDQLLFWLGRRHAGHPRIERLLQKPLIARFVAFIEHRPSAFILSFRFVWGMRTASPLALGSSHVSALRFTLLDIVAASLWGVVATGAGYLFGGAVERVLGHVRDVGLLLLAGLALVVLAILLLRRWQRRREAEDVSDPVA